MTTESPRLHCGSHEGSVRRGRHRERRDWRCDVLHVFILTSFAIAQPAYDRLGERGGFLLAREIRPPAVLLVIFLISCVLPAAVVIVERAVARWAPRVYESLHAIIVFALLALVALPACKRLTFLPASVVVSAGLAVAALATWCYFEFRRVRDAVTLTGLGIVLFPCVLVFHSSVTGLFFPPQSIQVTRWNPVPVVIVVFDEFCGSTLMTPERRIDADRFPNFARLAGEATWFRNATAVHIETVQALPSILTGRYADTTWSPLPADRPQNLFNVLEIAGGYELAAFEPISSLAPDQRVARDGPRAATWAQAAEILNVLARVYLFHVVPDDYDHRLPALPKLWFGLREFRQVDQSKHRGVFRYGWNQERDQQFEHFLRTIDSTSDATLNFIHLLAPHVPWCYLPSGRHYSADQDPVDLLSFDAHTGLVNFWSHDPLLVLQGQQRYLLQLQSIDRQLGRLVDRLQETGLFDRCLLIVTADHGVSFRADQPRREISSDNLADILSIPLFIKRPFQAAGEISERRVESVDIFPTVVDVLGIQLDEPTDGRSVFDTSRPERDQITYSRSIHPDAADPQIIVDSDVPRLLRQRFGDPRQADSLFQIGPIPELIGRKVESLPQSADSAFELELLRYGDTVAEDPATLIPCFFEGLVAGDVPNAQPIQIAVAINGTIHAVTRTYLLEGLRNRWSALVPENAFHVGRNEVQFFRVTQRAADWCLTPALIRQTPQTR